MGKEVAQGKIIVRKNISKPNPGLVRTYPILQSIKHSGQKYFSQSTKSNKGKSSSVLTATPVSDIFKDEPPLTLKKKPLKKTPGHMHAVNPRAKMKTTCLDVSPIRAEPMTEPPTKKCLPKTPVRKFNLRHPKPFLPAMRPVAPRPHWDFLQRKRLQPPRSRPPLSCYRLGEDRIPISLGDHQTEIIAVPLRSKFKHCFYSKKARKCKNTGIPSLSAVEKYQPLATDSEDSIQSITQTPVVNETSKVIGTPVSKKVKQLTSFWNKKIQLLMKTSGVLDKKKNTGSSTTNLGLDQVSISKIGTVKISQRVLNGTQSAPSLTTAAYENKPKFSIQATESISRDHMNINDVLTTLDTLNQFFTTVLTKDDENSQNVSTKIVELLKTMGSVNASWEKKVYLAPVSGRIMGHAKTQFTASFFCYSSGPYGVYEEYVAVGDSCMKLLDRSTTHSNEAGNNNMRFQKRSFLDEKRQCQTNNWFADRKLRSNFIIMTCLSTRPQCALKGTFDWDKKKPFNLFKYLTSPIHLVPLADIVEKTASYEKAVSYLSQVTGIKIELIESFVLIIQGRSTLTKILQGEPSKALSKLQLLATNAAEIKMSVEDTQFEILNILMKRCASEPQRAQEETDPNYMIEGAYEDNEEVLEDEEDEDGCTNASDEPPVEVQKNKLRDFFPHFWPEFLTQVLFDMAICIVAYLLFTRVINNNIQ